MRGRNQQLQMMRTMPTTYACRSRQIGFSLVEMAIVLLIVAVLLGGLLPTLSGQVEQQRRSDTRKYMNEVQDALLGYAVANGRLPCPDTTNDGVEDVAAAAITNNVPLTGQSTKIYPCGASVGSIPYNTIGISSKDSYNGTLIYAVTPAFGERDEIYSALNGSGALLYNNYFNLGSTGTMRVCATSSCTAPYLTSNAPAVIVSRGANGANTTPGDEAENNDNDTDFVSHDATPAFDDLVVWLSPNTLFNRMVAASKLP